MLFVVNEEVEALLGKIEIPASIKFAAGDPVPPVEIHHENGDVLELPRVADGGPALIVFFRGFW